MVYYNNHTKLNYIKIQHTYDTKKSTKYKLNKVQFHYQQLKQVIIFEIKDTSFVIFDFF
jgi:hypothetical protein